MAYVKNDYQTIFADSDAHIWQDTAHHVWIKEIIEEVLRRLSFIFKVLPDRFSSTVIRLSREGTALIDRFLTRGMR